MSSPRIQKAKEKMFRTIQYAIFAGAIVSVKEITQY